MELFDDDGREALLAVPASALDTVLGRVAPETYTVHRADGRVAHHALRTAIDRVRRETVEHSASTLPFEEDLVGLWRLLAPVLAPWPALRDASPEATDREVVAEWERLLAPWAAGIELDAAPVRRRQGDPPLPARGRSGLISVPGRGGTVWTLDDILSPAGIRRIRGLGRLEGGALHVYWRPAPGVASALLVDDVTDADHPVLPSWTLWAQPHAILQTSRYKTQCIFRVPSDLLSQVDALAVTLNGLLGDSGVRGASWWMRLPGTWNHKAPGASWCVRLLARCRNDKMEAGWLRNEATRMAKKCVSSRDSATVSISSSSVVQASRGVGVDVTRRTPLPEPENVREGRNVMATRAVGLYLAQHWGNAHGAETFLWQLNQRFPSPLDEGELKTILNSILREDFVHHPERWRGRTFPASASISRVSRSSKSKVAATSAQGDADDDGQGVPRP